MLSFANITLCSSNIFNNSNVSALDYSSNVGIGFTFNPTLSISLSSNDLVIPNLIPGNTLDSNSINVSVATNAAYGYTLSANVGDDIHNNSNLTHTNNTDIFSSIATNVGLASLDDSDESNIWGYSYKNNIASTPAWSNYSGLSNSVNKVLFNTDSNTGGSIDFKIAAKASNTQPSGEYTGTINFYAITKPTPMNLAESYFAHGKTRYNGYYTMQDMTTEICNDTEVIGEGSQTELIDIRDNKVYWATKLADNHCWMTQNLDLDLDSNRTYTHWDTDLGWSIEDGNTVDVNATWRPNYSTINFSGDTVGGWYNSYAYPRSANPGNKYVYVSNSDTGRVYNSLSECVDATSDIAGCPHYHIGNYYNWAAAVAENNIAYIEPYSNTNGSICSSGWRLPIGIDASKNPREFETLMIAEDILQNYSTIGFLNIQKSPLYIIKNGKIDNALLQDVGNNGVYLSATGNSYNYAFVLRFDNSDIENAHSINRSAGFSVRCLAR